MKKHLLVAMSVLACCLASLSASAQSCKPDVSQKDRISKKQIDQWNQVLTSTGLLRAALMDDDVSITAMVGRYGDSVFVSIQIRKQEENLARAAFEPQYPAAEGNQFIFGLKNGEPLPFVATGIVNQSKAGGHFWQANYDCYLVSPCPRQRSGIAKRCSDGKADRCGSHCPCDRRG